MSETAIKPTPETARRGHEDARIVQDIIYAIHHQEKKEPGYNGISGGVYEAVAHGIANGDTGNVWVGFNGGQWADQVGLSDETVGKRPSDADWDRTEKLVGRALKLYYEQGVRPSKEK